MRDRETLISALASDVQPVRPAMSADWLALIWLALSLVYVVAVSALWGPLRPNALHQLASEPRFLVEMLSGLLAIAVLACCAFRAAIPGRLRRGPVVVGFALLGLWLSQYIVGLWQPALAPSVAGERDLCWLQTGLYAIPPILVAFLITRRLYPLNPWQVALGFSMAAGMLPALYMQLACIYVVPHILQFHILPGLVVALVGTGLALCYRK